MTVPRPWRTVVVTGASGFVGRRLVAHLRDRGMTVIGLARTTGFDLLRDELPLSGVNRVIHLAGMTGVPASWEAPAVFYEANALGTVRILDACRRAGCGVTHMSAYVYGSPRSLPITEEHPLGTPNPYAFSKVAAEEACAFFESAYGLDCVRLRLFNAYGPGQEGDFLVPTIVAQVLDPTIDFVEVRDLSPARDFVHVDDVAEAVLATSLSKPGSVYNVGSGEAHTVDEVVRLALSVAGVNKPVRVTGEARRNELDRVVADIGAIRAATGWSPTISLREGLRTVAEAMRRT